MHGENVIAPFGEIGAPVEGHVDPPPARHLASGLKTKCGAIGQSAIADRAAAPADRLKRPMTGGRRYVRLVSGVAYNGLESGRGHDLSYPKLRWVVNATAS